MKALTIRQPWAQLVAVGAKTIETRSWKTSYRGTIAIHAGAHRPATVWHHDVNQDAPPEVDLVAMGSCWEWTEDVNDYTSGGAYRWTGPLGAVVATATLIDCVPINFGPAHPFEPNVYDIGGTLTLRRSAGQVWPDDVEAQRPFGDFTPGRYAWLIDDIQRCDPIPARGKQGLWNWEPT